MSDKEKAPAQQPYNPFLTYYLIAESPIHAGAGKEVGYIDNVIQREVSTGIPNISGESQKGALRQFWRKNKISDRDILFGPEAGGENAGAVSPAEAYTLFFPVQSYKGVMAWVTCPLVLARWKNRMSRFGNTVPAWKFGIVADNQFFCNAATLDVLPKKVVLDDLNLDRQEITAEEKHEKFENYFAEIFANHPLQDFFKTRCGVVSDNVFRFLVKYKTDVRTRNRIDPASGTAKDTGLFTVEYLPEMTVLHGSVSTQAEFKKDGKNETDIRKMFTDNKPAYFTLGGDKGVGKGNLKLIVNN